MPTDYRNKPTRWGEWFPAPEKMPDIDPREFVWYQQRDGGSAIHRADIVDWGWNTAYEEDEDLVCYRLREDHPLYMTSIESPPIDVDVLEENPLFGMF